MTELKKKLLFYANTILIIFIIFGFFHEIENSNNYKKYLILQSENPAGISAIDVTKMTPETRKIIIKFSEKEYGGFWLEFIQGVLAVTIFYFLIRFILSLGFGFFENTERKKEEEKAEEIYRSDTDHLSNEFRRLEEKKESSKKEAREELYRDMEDLKGLSELLKNGIITQEEFDRKKQEILND